MSRLHSLHFSTRQSDCLSAHHFPHRHRVLFRPAGMSTLGAEEPAGLGLEGAVSPVLGAVLRPSEAFAEFSAVGAPDSLLALPFPVERALEQHGSDAFLLVPVVTAGGMGRSCALIESHLAHLVLVSVGTSAHCDRLLLFVVGCRLSGIGLCKLPPPAQAAG